MTVIKNSNRINYGIKELLVDTLIEKDAINKDELAIGSMVYVTKAQQRYILNTQKEWDLLIDYAANQEPSDITNAILKSSTPNSTKRFKITVDDTGTLTATEVE